MNGLRVRRLSAEGRGAICVVALRGPGALARVAALASCADLATGSLRLVALEHAGERLDSALVAVIDQDEVELYLHGGRGVTEAVLHALGGESDADEAVDLEQAALRLMAAAPCEDAARILLDQAEGALRRELEELRVLPDAQARVRVAELLERARVARLALVPARVLLRGPVNAGKSTLFNALCGFERVLVSEEPGTTRDVVRERAQLGAWPIELWDTPGERPSAAPPSPGLDLERAGLALARELGRAADLLLWLAPKGEGVPVRAEDEAQFLVLASRADEMRSPAPGAICALSDPQGAVREVARRFREHFALPPAAWVSGAAVPFDEHQVEILRAARDLPRERRAELLEALLARRVEPQRRGG